MADIISNALAVLAVVLIGVALFALTIGNLTAAGMSFFSTSIVIYLRESRKHDDTSG